MSEDKAKKLAAEIQASSSSETFDLAGYGPEGLAQLVKAGLGTPIRSAEMMRLTFVCGGGKKVRQKYADNLPSLFGDALKSSGFVEDRGAAASLDCQGRYKFQHDTDKDLKFVHVFPRIAPPDTPGGEGDAALSPADLVIFADLPAFRTMVAKKTPSFSQRRRALDVLKAAKARLAAIEAKLAELQPLSEEEQSYYDSSDADGLQAKQDFLQALLEEMIAAGQLTKPEQSAVLEQLQQKLEAVEAQVAAAAAAGSSKKEAKLREAREKLEARRAAVSALKPIANRPKFASEIGAVQTRLAALDALERSAKVLSLDDALKLNARQKLLEDLKAMQAESRGWFAE